MKLLWLQLLLSSLIAFVAGAASSNDSRPRAIVKNGTLEGRLFPTTSTEAFLGIPYAEPPIGNLRFRHPRPHNSSWTGAKDVSDYSASCPGYGGFSANLTLNEDCLTLNVVRPANIQKNAKLPVLVWIYGGGFTGGATSDPRYDLSYMVRASVDINQPIIAVSLNYRLGSWGFLAGKEVIEKNMGLYDQRLALRWIQENIDSFGGDASKVTIWGESAGAFSVGFQMIAYNGQNDNLFRAAILESGTALAFGIKTQFDDSYQAMYDNITQEVGCFGKSDSLQCLREAPYAKVFNASSPFVFTPVIDGDIIPRLPSQSFKQGLIANVSLLVGSNTDEGTASFWGPRDTLQNDTSVYNYLSTLGIGLPASIVKDLMTLYPDVPSLGCPFNTGNDRFASQGYQYKRGAAIVGDLAIQAGRRQTAEYFASISKETKSKLFVYRFDQSPWNGIEELIATVAPVYSTHFVEIGFVFNNSNVNLTTWVGPDPKFHALSGLMSRSWISFAHSLDPNNHGVANTPQWNDYSHNKSLLVFNTDHVYEEIDNWRLPQLQYWQSIWELVQT